MKADRNGTIVTAKWAAHLIRLGWLLQRVGAQVIDGVSYWRIEDNGSYQYRLVSVEACRRAGIAPK